MSVGLNNWTGIGMEFRVRNCVVDEQIVHEELLPPKKIVEKGAE